MARPNKPDSYHEEDVDDRYADLPDIETDTSATSISIRPSFDQLNATLFSRGYLRQPLNISGLKSDAVDALADALHAIIAQREEDIQVRTSLTAKSRTLASSLERARRFLQEETDRSAECERKFEASKARISQLSHQLSEEQSAHRATKDVLDKTRRQLQTIKAAALQYRASADRSVARVRSRIGETTGSALRAAVPDFQIVTSAFQEPIARVSNPSLAEQQLDELERRRAELTESNLALKRFATETINAIRRADAELSDMVESEEAKYQQLSTLPLTSSSSSSSSSAAAAAKRKQQSIPESFSSESWLYGHRPLYQRDLFPSLQPLTTKATLLVASSIHNHGSGGGSNGTSNAASSSSSAKSIQQHPALKALEYTIHSFSTRIQTLHDLRTARSFAESDALKRSKSDAKELEWHNQLEQQVKAEIDTDPRLSVNRSNFSLAASAKRPEWHEEKRELEKKITELVGQLALTEENLTRKERQMKKLFDSDRMASMVADEEKQEHEKKQNKSKSKDTVDQQEKEKESQLIEIQRQKAELDSKKQKVSVMMETLEREKQQLKMDRERFETESKEKQRKEKMLALQQQQQQQHEKQPETIEKQSSSTNKTTHLFHVQVVSPPPPRSSRSSLRFSNSKSLVSPSSSSSLSQQQPPISSTSSSSSSLVAISSTNVNGGNPELDAIFGKPTSRPSKSSSSSSSNINVPPLPSKVTSSSSTVDKPTTSSSRILKRKQDLAIQSQPRKSRRLSQQSNTTTVSTSSSSSLQRKNQPLLPPSSSSSSRSNPSSASSSSSFKKPLPTTTTSSSAVKRSVSYSSSSARLSKLTRS